MSSVLLEKFLDTKDMGNKKKPLLGQAKFSLWKFKLLKLKLIPPQTSTAVQPYTTAPDLCSEHNLRLGIYSLTFVHQDCCQVIEHHVLLGVLSGPCQLCCPPAVGVRLLVASLSIQHRGQVTHQHHTLHQEGKGKLVEQSGAAEAPHSFPGTAVKAVFPREVFSKEVSCICMLVLPGRKTASGSAGPVWQQQSCSKAASFPTAQPFLP